MHSSSLDTALCQFEACEANLKKLERLWQQIESLLPDGPAFGAPPEYDQRCREFRAVLGHLPGIDGWKLPDELPDYNDVGQARLDAFELAEITVTASVEESIATTGRSLAEYRFRFDRKRRELVRSAVVSLIDQIDASLKAVEPALASYTNPGQPVFGPEVDAVRDAIAQIHTLLGSSAKRPAGWSDLARHLRFGQVHDLEDILKHDWPKVRAGLPRSVYGENEPLPVSVADLGEIVAARPSGPVVTKLQWSRLTPEDFERLVFSLISGEPGYENPEWLTKTNAPDRGRDLSVYRGVVDALSGSLRSRVLIQCRHWLEKSISVGDVATLKEQVLLWEPPRVNVVVIATSGRFTSDAVQAIEKHNEAGHSLRIEMWPESHLERLLAARPALIAEFGLRRSRDEELREALGTLDLRALMLQDKIQCGFMFTERTGPNELVCGVRDGVDGKLAISVGGCVVMVKHAIEQAWLGRFPVTIPIDFNQQNACASCATLEEVIAKAAEVLERAELWASRQSPK